MKQMRDCFGSAFVDARILTFCVCLLMDIARSHSDGHGPKLEGGGLLGGRMAAVISANDADKKKDVDVHFHAELATLQGRLRVGLLDKYAGIPLDIMPQSGKVIVFSGAEKPRVLHAEPIFGGLLLPASLKSNDKMTYEIIWVLPDGKFVSLFPNQTL